MVIPGRNSLFAILIAFGVVACGSGGSGNNSVTANPNPGNNSANNGTGANNTGTNGANNSNTSTSNNNASNGTTNTNNNGGTGTTPPPTGDTLGATSLDQLAGTWFGTLGIDNPEETHYFQFAVNGSGAISDVKCDGVPQSTTGSITKAPDAANGFHFTVTNTPCQHGALHGIIVAEAGGHMLYVDDILEIAILQKGTPPGQRPQFEQQFINNQSWSGAHVTGTPTEGSPPDFASISVGSASLTCTPNPLDSHNNLNSTCIFIHDDGVVHDFPAMRLENGIDNGIADVGDQWGAHESTQTADVIPWSRMYMSADRQFLGALTCREFTSSPFRCDFYLLRSS